MNREDIEKAAKHTIDEYSLNPEYGSYFEHGFIDGAEWRINSVWHNLDKELPECNRHVVNEDWLDFIAKDEKDLKRIMKQYPFKQWAYIEDLLPNTED